MPENINQTLANAILALANEIISAHEEDELTLSTYDTDLVYGAVDTRELHRTHGFTELTEIMADMVKIVNDSRGAF